MRLTTRTQLVLPGLLLLVEVTSFPRRLSADVMPPQLFAPHIVISSSADYPEMIFVIYRIDQEENSKGETFPADPGTALIIPPVTGIQLPSKDLFLDAYLVLAVPRAFADKTKNGPDSAWLEPAAPGVVRVSGILQASPRVPRGAPLL